MCLDRTTEKRKEEQRDGGRDEEKLKSKWTKWVTFESHH